MQARLSVSGSQAHRTRPLSPPSRSPRTRHRSQTSEPRDWPAGRCTTRPGRTAPDSCAWPPTRPATPRSRRSKHPATPAVPPPPTSSAHVRGQGQRHPRRPGRARGPARRARTDAALLVPRSNHPVSSRPCRDPHGQRRCSLSSRRLSHCSCPWTWRPPPSTRSWAFLLWSTRASPGALRGGGTVAIGGSPWSARGARFTWNVGAPSAASPTRFHVKR
jgi:hypothetical protein